MQQFTSCGGLPRPTPITAGPSPAPSFRTGFAGWDGLTGGLQGMMVLAGPCDNLRETLALSLTISALRANPRLGAVVYALGRPRREHIVTIQAVVSGQTWKTIDRGELTPSEREQFRRESEQFFDAVRPRLWIVDLPPPWGPIPRPDVPLCAHWFLRERQWLLDTGTVDNCMVVIDNLHLIGVPDHPDPAAGDPAHWVVASSRTLHRRRLEVALEVQRQMTTWGLYPSDPVLAVAGMARRRESGQRIEDIRGQPAGLAAAVGLIREPPIGREDDRECQVSLDVTVGDHGRVHRLPLTYSFANCRFQDQTTGQGIGW